MFYRCDVGELLYEWRTEVIRVLLLQFRQKASSGGRQVGLRWSPSPVQHVQPSGEIRL